MAYASLADCHWLRSFWGNLPPKQTYPIARDLVRKAIEIDDTLGEAHASLAAIYGFYEWDWAAANQEFERALELAPGSSDAHLFHSCYLSLRGQHDEAIAEARKAQELDPLSSMVNAYLGQKCWLARRYREAIEVSQKWLLMEPNNWFARLHLGIAYQEKSMFQEAIAEMEKAVELSGGAAMAVKILIMAHSRFGRAEVAEHLFDSLKERAAHEYVPPTCFVYIHLIRGEKDQAVEWARKACAARDGFLPMFRVAPFDSLELPSEPRIDALLDRMGLP
jgi:tetratricopeptide (TPR) repeat protein